MSSLAGNILVARPPLRDSFFGRTVILLLQHDQDDGAFGLVLNRPAESMDLPFPADAKDLPFPVYVGGPCKLNGLLMIHGCSDWLKPEDAEINATVCPGVYLGTSELFEKVAEGDDIGSDRFRVFTGYSGWSPQQLESELHEGAWIVLPANGDVIFGTPVQELWESLAPTTLPKPSMN